MERTLERKSLNGFTYKFVEWEMFGRTSVSTYFSKDGKNFTHNTKNFNTLEEANAWIDKMDAAVLAPKPTFEPARIPADYYADCSRYYGD